MVGLFNSEKWKRNHGKMPITTNILGKMPTDTNILGKMTTDTMGRPPTIQGKMATDRVVRESISGL